MARAVHKLFKKTSQKLSVKLSEGGPAASLKTGGPKDRYFWPP